MGFRDEEWKPSFGLWRGRKHPFRVFQTSEVQSRAWRIFWREGWSNPGGDPALPTGPLSSILVTRFGCRPVMLTGGLLASAGMILASFASRLLEVYLTAGVLTGEGTHVFSLQGCGWHNPHVGAGRESLPQVSRFPVSPKGVPP